MTPDDTTQTAQGAAQTAQGAAAAVIGAVRETVQGTGRETLATVRARAGDAATRTAEAARAEAMDRAETAKDTLADQGSRLAQSLRSAADGGDDSIQARLMAAAADSVADLSDSLRGRSLSDLIGDAEGFARRNPGAFVLAAGAAGFALARFARASAPTPAYGAAGAPRGARGAYGSPRALSAGAGPVSTRGLSTHDDATDDDALGEGLSAARSPS